MTTTTAASEETGNQPRSERWIGSKYWSEGARPAMTLNDIIATADQCVVAFDGGGLDDLLSMSVLGRNAKTRKWMHWSKVWADSDILTLRKEISEPLAGLVAEGDLTLVNDLEAEAFPAIVGLCDQLRQAQLLPDEGGFGMPPDGVSTIVDALIDADFTDDDIWGISQGWRMNWAVELTPVKLKNDSLRHCDQPHMRWCASEAKTERRGNSLLVTKERSAPALVGPLLALFSSVLLMNRALVSGEQRQAEHTGK